MKKALIFSLVLALLLSGCTIGPITIGRTTTTATAVTAAPTTPAATTAATTATAATVKTTAAATTTAVKTTAAPPSTTAAPAYSRIMGTPFFLGGWYCAQIGLRMEMGEYSDIVFASDNAEDACYGTWLYDGEILMASVYDPEGDATVVFSFDAVAGPGEADVPL